TRPAGGAAADAGFALGAARETCLSEVMVSPGNSPASPCQTVKPSYAAESEISSQAAMTSSRSTRRMVGLQTMIECKSQPHRCQRTDCSHSLPNVQLEENRILRARVPGKQVHTKPH